MWLVWVSAIHLNFIRITVQFNLQAWHHRSPYQQQRITEDPIFFPYYHLSHPTMSMPIHGFNRNLYPISFPISAQPSLSLAALTIPTSTLQNLPFQSAWMMTTTSPLLQKQPKDYDGYVAEMEKSDDYISTTTKNDYKISVRVKPNLPDFLRGTTDDVQKNFYQIISNPEESFQQKQNKLDQLIFTLSSKNQELYDQYRRMKDIEEREKRERVHAIVANMSNKAQAVFAKLSAVMMNPTMKDIDRMNKINDFYKNVDEDVKNEFKDKINGMNLQL